MAGPCAVSSASETCLPVESDRENEGAGALVATDGVRVCRHAAAKSAVSAPRTSNRRVIGGVWAVEGTYILRPYDGGAIVGKRF